MVLFVRPIPGTFVGLSLVIVSDRFRQVGHEIVVERRVSKGFDGRTDRTQRFGQSRRVGPQNPDSFMDSKETVRIVA